MRFDTMNGHLPGFVAPAGQIEGKGGITPEGSGSGVGGPATGDGGLTKEQVEAAIARTGGHNVHEIIPDPRVQVAQLSTLTSLISGVRDGFIAAINQAGQTQRAQIDANMREAVARLTGQVNALSQLDPVAGAQAQAQLNAMMMQMQARGFNTQGWWGVGMDPNTRNILVGMGVVAVVGLGAYLLLRRRPRARENPVVVRGGRRVFIPQHKLNRRRRRR